MGRPSLRRVAVLGLLLRVGLLMVLWVGRLGERSVWAKKRPTTVSAAGFVESHLASTSPSGTGKYYGYYRYAKGCTGKFNMLGGGFSERRSGQWSSEPWPCVPLLSAPCATRGAALESAS